jgi:hypothetical protein
VGHLGRVGSSTRGPSCTNTHKNYPHKKLRYILSETFSNVTNGFDTFQIQISKIFVQILLFTILHEFVTDTKIRK